MANLRKQKLADSWVDATGVNALPLTSYSRTTKLLALGISLVTLSIWSLSSRLPPLRLHRALPTIPSRFAPSDACPQATTLTPQSHAPIWEGLLKEATTEEYERKAVEWLSGAIQIACVHSWCSSGLGVLIVSLLSLQNGIL